MKGKMLLFHVSIFHEPCCIRCNIPNLVLACSLIELYLSLFPYGRLFLTLATKQTNQQDFLHVLWNSYSAKVYLWTFESFTDTIVSWWYCCVIYVLNQGLIVNVWKLYIYNCVLVILLCNICVLFIDIFLKSQFCELLFLSYLLI